MFPVPSKMNPGGSLARPESPRFKPSGRKATTIIIVVARAYLLRRGTAALIPPAAISIADSASYQ
jgi:hypothetical protein